MNSAVGPIFNEKIADSEVCGSCEQCTRPNDNAILDQCMDVQSASGSCAQCTGPTSRSVSHVKPNSGIKKKLKKKKSKCENSKRRCETS